MDKKFHFSWYGLYPNLDTDFMEHIACLKQKKIEAEQDAMLRVIEARKKK